MPQTGLECLFLEIMYVFRILNFGHCDLPFDLAQGGELVEPLGIWYLWFGISGLSGLGNDRQKYDKLLHFEAEYLDIGLPREATIISTNGPEAMDIYTAKKADIDLVILDMIMPGMGGGEIYDKVKEINPHAKVLLSSGYSIEGKAKAIMDRGCNGFIQ